MDCVVDWLLLLHLANRELGLSRSIEIPVAVLWHCSIFGVLTAGFDAPATRGGRDRSSDSIGSLVFADGRASFARAPVWRQSVSLDLYRGRYWFARVPVCGRRIWKLGGAMVAHGEQLEVGPL